MPTAIHDTGRLAKAMTVPIRINVHAKHKRADLRFHCRQGARSWLVKISPGLPKQSNTTMINTIAQ